MPHYLVPGYYSPTIKMRLLSPQNYCHYHNLNPSKAQHYGSLDWISLTSAVHTKPDIQATDSIHTEDLKPGDYISID